MSTIDTDGKTVRITEDNMVRVDGIGVFRCIERDGVLYAQFKDTNRIRINCRGSQLMEIPLHIMVEKINQIHTRKKTNGRNATNTIQS